MSESLNKVPHGSRSFLFLCFASFFAGLSIGYIKFFLLGELVESIYTLNDKSWIIQTLGALITLGPCLIFFMSGPLAAAFKKSWVMYLSAACLAIIMLVGNLSHWLGSVWLYIFLAGLGLGIFNAARNSAVPIEAAKSEHSIEFINAWVNNLYLAGLLFGVPLGTEIHTIAPASGGYLNCLLFCFCSLFGLLSSIRGEHDHLKTFKEAQGKLTDDCLFLGKNFSLFLLSSPILWGIAGALSLAATAYVEQRGLASSLLASLMSIYAAFGVAAGNLIATKLSSQRYRAAFYMSILLALAVALTPISAELALQFGLNNMQAYIAVSILMLVCGLSFGCATNLLEAEYLKEIYQFKQEGTGAALLSAKTAFWSFILGGLTGLAVHRGWLDLDSQFTGIASMALIVTVIIRKLEKQKNSKDKP